MRREGGGEGDEEEETVRGEVTGDGAAGGGSWG
jgi:hypothetical protein